VARSDSAPLCGDSISRLLSQAKSYRTKLLGVSNQLQSRTSRHTTTVHAAILLQYKILNQRVDLRYIQAGVFSDNMPTVAWSKRMADKFQSLTAGRLLRGLAAMQCATRAGPLTVASISGKTNNMANIASCSFNTASFVPDATFLTHFNTRFPLPQNYPGNLCTLRAR
jgi:hypothetical protein